MSEEIKRFKLRDEKQVASEILLMEWSPTMDLIAFANANGEVLVNRLSWQRVWLLPAYDERQKQIYVSALSWRPDGKVLAVGYTSGIFRLCDVEKGEIIREEVEVKDRITSLVWLEQSKSMVEGQQTYPEDNSSTYLPQAQQQNSLYSDSTMPKTQPPGHEIQEIFRSLASKKELGLLLVGTDTNKVHLYGYGVFHLCVLELSIDNASESLIVDSAIISPDLSRLAVVLKSVDSNEMYSSHIQTYDTALLVTRHEEIRLLCAKYIMIISSDLEIDLILKQMCEAWEEILREMDSKLLRFAKSKQERKEGSVSNDFLELLLFGTTSLETQSFLLQDLTDKGLKKLGYSIENSYSDIQKLVVCQLQRATQNMTAHLNDLHGMSQWYDKFGVLGLSQEAVYTALQSAGEFAVSAHEIQQVIDTSIKNFKAFFRWLYIAILRLSNEQPPAEINKMTQHDIKFVADFLKDSFTNLLGEDDEERNETSFDIETENEDMSESTGGFRLEKVGQYLKDVDLVQPPDYNKNPWVKFLNSSTALKGSKILHTETMQGKSMKQRKNMMVSSYLATEKPIAKTIGDSMRNVSSLQLFSYSKTHQTLPKVCQFIDEKTSMLWTVFVEQETSVEYLYLLKHPVYDASTFDVSRVNVGVIGFGEPNQDEQISDSPPCDRHFFLDFAVFNPQTLTLMLQEVHAPSDTALSDGEVTLLVQLPLSAIPDSQFVKFRPDTYTQGCQVPSLDVGPQLSRASVSYQTDVVGHSLAVGGVRTTASMLMCGQRRIRLFLLEDGDEEDDDEEEGTTRGDNSQQEESSTDASRTGIDMDDSRQDDDKENSTD